MNDGSARRRPSWLGTSAHGTRLVGGLVGMGLVIAALAFKEARGPAILALMLAAGLLFIGVGVFLPHVREVNAGPFKAALGNNAVMAPGAVHDAAKLQSERELQETSLDDEREVLSAARLSAAESAFKQLLATRTSGPLAGCEFRLFLWDDDACRLLPSFSPSIDDQRPSTERGWLVGQGATGQAFARGAYVYVDGRGVTSDDYDLTERQKARSAGLATVASHPVKTASGRTIAVVSVSATEPSNGIDSDQGQAEHILVAESAARVLIDLLGWSTDTDVAQGFHESRPGHLRAGEGTGDGTGPERVETNPQAHAGAGQGHRESG